MADKRTAEKIHCFEEWMKGDHVMVHLDARAPGVHVPASHADNPKLTLQLSYLFQGETTHNNSGIETYLKFQGQYFCCQLPWTSIWGLSSAAGESKFWPQDMPKEMLLSIAQSKLQSVGKRLFGKKDEKEEATPATPRSRSRNLSSVSGTAVDAGTNKKSDGSGKRSPSLKRVK